MNEIINVPVFKKVELILNDEFEGILSEELKVKSSTILDAIQIPTTRTEAWKYTRLGKISNKKFTARKGIVTNISDFNVAHDVYTLVFVNGFLNTELSTENLPEGVVCKSITEASSDETFSKYIGRNLKLENEVFNCLNTSYGTDGAFIHIASKVILEKPLQILHIQTEVNTISNLRNLIVSEKNSEAKIIQGYFSQNASESFTNVVTEVFVEENAHLTIDKIQYEDDSCYQIATEQVQQEKNSTFTINTITLNGGLVRNNLNIEVKGQNCCTNLNGTYILKGNQHVDNHTTVDHIAANCESHELYKGVVNDKSTAVFNGKVFVRKDAQKINAFQSNANVLLSDDSTVNSKPELEIYADDVKCSHGSTTGQLDEEAVFYLRARGLSEMSARKLMISAFINDVIEKVENEEVKEFVFNILQQRFDWEK
jgi:Fe-S cluster assembly protein SufD